MPWYSSVKHGPNTYGQGVQNAARSLRARAEMTSICARRACRPSSSLFAPPFFRLRRESIDARGKLSRPRAFMYCGYIRCLRESNCVARLARQTFLAGEASIEKLAITQCYAIQAHEPCLVRRKTSSTAPSAKSPASRFC
eukprot:4207309-Pleurochrysis_carterae.AAC.1